MEKKTGKTLESLGRGAPMPEPELEPPEWQRVINEMPRPYIPKAPPTPMDVKLDNLRALDDDTLMRLLTREVGHQERPLSDGTKMAITTELMRRQAKTAERPAWWRDPYFWVAAVAAVFAGLAAYPVLMPSTPATAPTELPRSTAEQPSAPPPAAAGSNAR